MKPSTTCLESTKFSKSPLCLITLCAVIAVPSLMASHSMAQDFSPQTPTQSSSSAAPNNPVPLSDNEFLKTVPQTLRTQIELAKIAATEAHDNRVREYAGWILKDYEPALEKLQQAAAANKLEVPATIDASNKRLVETLQQKPPQQRDSSYLQLVKQQHDSLIALFEYAHSQSALAVEFRDFSDKLLPTLQQYQKRAEKLIAQSSTLSNAL